MAAVIIALRNRISGRSSDVDRTGSSASLDEDDDGKVSTTEVLRNLHTIGVQADRMVMLLRLEGDLLHMTAKMPGFCLCMLCFVVALVEFSPPAALANVHRRLHSHFDLGQVATVKDFSGIYDYISSFEHQNEDLQATSYKYWCEKRYSVHQWDDDLEIPTHRCPSPRLYALNLLADASYRWTSASSGNGSGINGSGINGSGTGSGSGGSGSSSSSSSGHGATPLAPPCVDHDAQLRTQEGDANATCPSWAVDPHHRVCESDVGVSLCPQTCGFCAPFKYDHLLRFARPQVTMLPVMLYQTRFTASACHGFAETYELQPYNPLLSVLPAIDGPRNGRVLTCIDREQRQESEYAIELDCTRDTPAHFCHSGKVQITKRHTFHGDVIYPLLVIEPARDIAKMKEVEWVDLQTDTISLSTMVYTEGIEVFTSLTVDFKLDAAGNIDGSYTMISYRDLLGGSKDTFLGCLITCMVGALLGVVISLIYMFNHPGAIRDGQLGYELLSRSLLFVYPLVLLIGWAMQVPMAAEYDHLLHAFLDLTGISEADLEGTIQRYFDAKTHLHAEVSWLTAHRIAAYFVLYVQFLQLIFYFNAHPKMAILTATVQKALGNIVHFLGLFAMFYVMLGFMANWMLGPYIPAFSTFGETCKSQVRMIFGEFIEANMVPTLKGSMMFMYWLYAGTFMLLVIWTLLNFFLAIIIDAFMEVKTENQKTVARDFLTDTLAALRTWFIAARRGWPSREALITFFQEQVDSAEAIPPKYCPSDCITGAFPRFDSRRVASFLAHYERQCNSLLVRCDEVRSAQEAFRADPKQP